MTASIHRAVSSINEAIECVMNADDLTNQEKLDVIQQLGAGKVILKQEAAVIESFDVSEPAYLAD